MSGQTRSASSQFWSWFLRPVAAHERVDERDVHLLGRVDHVPEVADDLRRGAPGPGGAGWGRSRGPRSRDPCASISARMSCAWRARQVRDVDVARARVAPGRAGRLRPAGDLEHLEARAGGPVGDLHQRRLGERGGQEAELHRGCTSAAIRAVRSTLDPAAARGRSARWRHRRASRRGRPRTWDTSGRSAGAAGEDVVVDRAEQRAERVGEALDVTAREARGRGAGRVHEGGVAEQELVGAVAVTDPQLVGLLRVPRDGGRGAVDLVLEAVLPARGSAGEIATEPRAPPSKRRRIVATSSVWMSIGDRVGRRAPSRTSATGPVGLWRTGMNVVRSAMTALDVRAR